VELDREFQKKDVDLQIRESEDVNSSDSIATELKCESPTRGNIALELWSYWAKKVWDAVTKEYVPDEVPDEDKTKGWLQYSETACLVTCLRHTGDVLMFDFEKLKEWVKTTRCPIPLKRCTAPEQTYFSQSHIVRINDVLAELPEAVHLNISDWLPTLYQGEFSKSCLVNPKNQARKTLKPIRIAWPF
jgi:hypothetical protein